MGEPRLDGTQVLPAAPRAGVGLHFSSLPARHGIGDIGDASRKFLNNLVSMRIKVWQFLPTGPTAFGNSPYQPLSAFAGNEMLIGLDPLVRGGLLTNDEVETLAGLPDHAVDYGRLIPAKQALLATAASRFQQVADSGLKADYDHFLDRHADAWLNDYVLYRVLKTRHGERPWPEWAPEFVHRESAALRAARTELAEHLESLRIVQFLFDRQWRMLRQRAREAGVQLFGDIPIYIAHDSADAWAHPEILRIDADGHPSHVSGVPPDYFSEDGQLWGNPLYDWDHQRDTGFSWWVDRIRHAAEMMDFVRIDHFRGFEAFWSVPGEASTAREGEWVKGPGDALFEAIRAELGNLPIVAEDLGVITREVDALRHRHCIPGMEVLQFKVSDPAFKPETIGENSVCYTGTHDNDTTVGWFLGSDNDTRTEEEIRLTRENALRLTGGTPEEIHMDMIRMALNSKARLAVAPMQDFLGLGSEARFNIPGTTLNNWRWRLRPGQLDKHVRASIAAMVDASSRG